VTEGDVLAQRYRIEKPLGTGTMAFVVLAHDMVINEIVACKIPLDSSEARTQAIKRQHRLFRNRCTDRTWRLSRGACRMRACEGTTRQSSGRSWSSW